MRTAHFTLPALVLASAAWACGQAKSAGPTGQIHISAAAKVSAAAQENGSPGALCATFTLTPYSVSSTGALAQAGDAVSFSTSSTSDQTAQILGCIASSDTFDFPNPSGQGTTQANWAYLVSATDFVYCDAADGTLDPSTLAPASSFFAPVDCTASQDVPLDIEYPVSISVSSAGGYIDISAGVDATTTFVGCKTPDLDPASGALHFGEASTSLTSTAPLGLVGYTADGQSADPLLEQYGGQIFEPSGADTLFDTSYTGQFNAQPSSGQFPSTILSTFLSDANEESPYDPSCKTEWADARHALCLTDTASLSAGAQLADVFLFLPGKGYAAASVRADRQAIDVRAQMLPNSGADYTPAANGFPATLEASSGFASSASAPGAAGFNDGLVLTSVLIPASPALTALTGVYVDTGNPGGFLVAATDGSHQYWASLQFAGAGWAFGPFTDLGAGPLPAGYGLEQSGCIQQGCAAIAARPGAQSGTYPIELGGAITDVYCDVSGGGWTAVENQDPDDSELPDEVDDVNPASFGALDKSWRIGHDTLSKVAPATAWKLVDEDSAITIYFKPDCRVDWTVDYSGATSGNDCITAYYDLAFTQPVNGGWIPVAARGIGVNNSDNNCSMRGYFSVELPPRHIGEMLDCNGSPGHVSLWFQ